jgi:hypothetical protein
VSALSPASCAPARHLLTSVNPKTFPILLVMWHTEPSARPASHPGVGVQTYVG